MFGGGGYFAKPPPVAGANPNLVELGQTKLLAPGGIVSVNFGGQTVGLGGTFFKALVTIEADVSGNVANPKLYLNADRVNANYWNFVAASVNDPRIFSGTMFAATPYMWIVELWQESLSGNKYFNAQVFCHRANASAGSFRITYRWNNAGAVNFITQLELNKDGAVPNFITGSKVSVWGIRRSIFT